MDPASTGQPGCPPGPEATPPIIQDKTTSLDNSRSETIDPQAISELLIPADTGSDIMSDHST